MVRRRLHRAVVAILILLIWPQNGAGPVSGSSAGQTGRFAPPFVKRRSSTSTPCGGTRAPVVTWIVAGQSQATTFGMSRRTLPFAWASDPEAFIWVWDDELQRGRWEAYEPGVNSAPRGRWGPEAQLIRELRARYPTARLAVIKYAPGQTGVALDPNQRDWNVHSRHEAWDRLSAMTDAALASCRLRLDAVFWMGNHHDGLSQEKASRVRENMRELVEASRAKWGSGVRWIVGIPDDTAAYAATVRRGVADLDRADPQMASFDTANYTLQSDGLHYDAAAVIRLGRDFYAGWERLAAPHSEERMPSGPRRTDGGA